MDKMQHPTSLDHAQKSLELLIGKWEQILNMVDECQRQCDIRNEVNSRALRLGKKLNQKCEERPNDGKPTPPNGCGSR